MTPQTFDRIFESTANISAAVNALIKTEITPHQKQVICRIEVENQEIFGAVKDAQKDRIYQHTYNQRYSNPLPDNREIVAQNLEASQSTITEQDLS